MRQGVSDPNRGGLTYAEEVVHRDVGVRVWAVSRQSRAVRHCGQQARRAYRCRGRGGVEMIAIIDNYDSFTYNLVQYLGELGADVVVHRNDKITLKDKIYLIKNRSLTREYL